MVSSVVVTGDPLILSWQALAAMVSISTTIVTVAVIVLRIFVDSRLAETKAAIIDRIAQTSGDTYLSKHFGELLDLRLRQIEEKLEKLEERLNHEQA